MRRKNKIGRECMKKLWTIIFMGGLIASYGAFEVTQAAEKKREGISN